MHQNGPPDSSFSASRRRRFGVDQVTVEFCERYDENCFDPDYDWLPPEHFAPAVQEVFSHKQAFR